MLASRRSGYALKMATMIVSATATGYTISRGRAATPKTALPNPIDRKIPTAHHPPCQAKQRGLRKEKPQHAAHRTTDGLHQADVVLPLHRHVGHRRHHAQAREHQHDRHCRRPQPAYTVVDLRFAFRKLSNPMYIRVGHTLRKCGDEALNAAWRTLRTDQNEANATRQAR